MKKIDLRSKKWCSEIIDLLHKKAKEANNKLVEVSEELDELLIFEEDEDLIATSRYQVLNQL
jgi:hypothetical protein